MGKFVSSREVGKVFDRRREILKRLVLFHLLQSFPYVCPVTVLDDHLRFLTIHSRLSVSPMSNMRCIKVLCLDCEAIPPVLLSPLVPRLLRRASYYATCTMRDR